MSDERWLDSDAIKALLEPVAHFELFHDSSLADQRVFRLSRHERGGAVYTHLDLGAAVERNPVVLVQMNRLPRAFSHYRNAQSGWPRFFLRREGAWSQFRRFFTNRVGVDEPPGFGEAFVLRGENANAIRSAVTVRARQALLDTDLDPDLSIEVEGAWLLAWTDGELRDPHRRAVVLETRKVTEALMLASA